MDEAETDGIADSELVGSAAVPGPVLTARVLVLHETAREAPCVYT